ncbi:MAG: 23S rRNA (uracil(1939)-C(5))-methyltransferase RlmD [Gammaproteobacteria bacterium]|nr:23S rRNA (uracil(1939)-C(5))-methyltransferase RlmD [Gammaproteobacteria bacterium]
MRYLSDDCQWQSPITSPEWGYRRRARVGVHVNKRGDLALGFRQRASNDLVNISQCPVLVEPFQALFTPLTQLVEQLKARDKVGHLEFIAPDNGLFIIIRLLTELLAEDRALLATFSSEHQLTFLIEDNDGNILDLAGKQPSPLHYQLNGDILAFNAGDFIQINAQVNQKMVDQAVDWLELKTTDKVLDLFCGIGNFSLSIAKKSQLVVGVEGVKEMVEQASHNATAAGLSNISFYHSDLSQPLADQAWYSRKLGEQVDKILLDPARDGATAIVEQLSKLKPSIIVYVSCEPSSLERDSKVIIDQGYKLEKMCVMDMFPQTTHLESMALFRKI